MKGKLNFDSAQTSFFDLKKRPKFKMFPTSIPGSAFDFVETKCLIFDNYVNDSIVKQLKEAQEYITGLQKQL